MCRNVDETIGSVGKPRTEELLSLVLKNAVDIKFGLQTYAFEMRRAGKRDEADRLLKVGDDINRLFYEVMAETHVDD